MKNIIHTLITLIFAALWLLTACSPKETTANLTGKTWELVSIVGQPAIMGIKTSLIFSEDGTINGNVGCNSFSGNYRQSGNELDFSQMLSTMMACEDAIMEQEYGVLSALNGTLTFQTKGSILSLFTADGTPTLVLTVSH